MTHAARLFVIREMIARLRSEERFYLSLAADDLIAAADFIGGDGETLDSEQADRIAASLRNMAGGI